MATEEELNKSIDLLIDEVFGDEPVEKSIDIAGDASTTADSVVNKAPKGQDDASRGAGRPKEISDVPDNDTDGKRAGTYDGDITENENKEDEPSETDQVEGTDQVTEGKGRIKPSGKAPASRPFKKSFTEEEWDEYQALKKAQEVEEDMEELSKSDDTLQKSIEALVKSNEDLIKSNNELKQRVEEQDVLIKAVAKTPKSPKSIAGIGQLEKGAVIDTAQPEAFSKSEMLDAAEELVKSGKIPLDAVYELETTGNIFNEEHRKLVQSKLEQG